ncbi:MAG: two-component sensor histidine kinase [Alphaproteobacteria bacterium]|nr:two-component sensor histidine kinase [Alphaproteobacteria bacterium]
MASLKDIFRFYRLRLLPRRLLPRSILILVLPVVLIQSVSGILFYDNHWQNISRRLALGIASDIKGAFALYDDFPNEDDRKIIVNDIRASAGLNILFSEPQEPPENIRLKANNKTTELIPALRTVGYPFTLSDLPEERRLLITFYLPDYTAEILLPYKLFFSSTTYVFAFWALFSSLLFTGIAIVFLRNQMRPILRLAEATKNFGLGRDVNDFKPEGAAEVRQASLSFLQMRDRIRRHIEERTRMLAGVSHDLRTPLTRMRLQLAMMDKNDDIENLMEDVTEMEHMVNGYLDFARGGDKEKAQSTDIRQLVSDTLDGLQKNGLAVQFNCNYSLIMDIRRNDFKRCLWNLVTNAGRYGTQINVSMTVSDKCLEIAVEDNGPGIPANKRDDVFKAFFRLDESRNPETGGVGLGLTITRDIVTAHGGKIYMEDSALGGLKVVMVFPI